MARNARSQREHDRATSRGFDTAYHQRAARRAYKDATGEQAPIGATKTDLARMARSGRWVPTDREFKKAFRFDQKDRDAWKNLFSK